VNPLILLNKADRALACRATFPVRSRLIKPSDFKRVFKKPVVSSDHCFRVLARRNDGDHSRLGMAVSRQVDRHAVGRNRIKRVIRESFRQSFESVVPETLEKFNKGGKNDSVIEENNPGIDIVVLPRQQAASICNQQLFDSLHAHWSRLRQEKG
jgi:ribonuclease P protein component